MLSPREPARPALIREHPLAPWFAVWTVCFGAFMGQLDASVVTVAFPALQHQFGTGLAHVQWVSLAYLIALVALLVPVGRWSDRVGRKLMYLYGFVLFAAASAACGLAPTLLVLIILRVVQAGGAALLQANSVALVSTSMPPASRRSGLAVQAAAQALGLAVGPVAGGVLVASVGWRWIFLINVPIGLVAVSAGVFLLPRTRQRATQRSYDPFGTVLLAAAAGGLLIAVSSASGLHLPVWIVALSAIGAAAGGPTLLWWERRSPEPLIDLAVLRSTGIGPALAGALCAYMVLFGPLVLLPQTLIGQGSGALAAGLILAALPASFGLAAMAADRLLPHRWSNRRRCQIGGVLASCGMAALAIPSPHALMTLPLALLGAGLGTYIPANNAQIMTAVTAHEAATTGGMVNMARGLGTALGVALVSLSLHVGAGLGLADASRLAVAALFATALAAIWAGNRTRSHIELGAATLGAREGRKGKESHQ